MCGNKNIFEDSRLLLFENKSRLISIARWTREYYLVILETEYLNKTNILITESTISAIENVHVLMSTVYGAWTVCKSKFELYRWNSKYYCFENNYSTADKPSQMFL